MTGLRDGWEKDERFAVYYYKPGKYRLAEVSYANSGGYTATVNLGSYRVSKEFKSYESAMKAVEKSVQDWFMQSGLLRARAHQIVHEELAKLTSRDLPQ